MASIPHEEVLGLNIPPPKYRSVSSPDFVVSYEPV